MNSLSPPSYDEPASIPLQPGQQTLPPWLTLLLLKLKPEPELKLKPELRLKPEPELIRSVLMLLLLHERMYPY